MLEEIDKKLKEERTLVLMHLNADPDAYGCAVALSRTYPDVTIGVPDGLSRTAKRLQQRIGEEVVINPDPKEYDLTVIVDTSSPEQLGDVDLGDIKPIIIDHHTRIECWEGCLYCCDEKFTSCAEIVWELVKMNKKEGDEITALALLAGIITDTGNFRHGTSNTLKTFAEIMDRSGVELDEVFEALGNENDEDLSRRISQLKGASRLKFERTKEHIVATTTSSAFESSVCRTLLHLGADVAFVGAQRKDEFRISSRAKGKVVKEGIHLGKLMNDIANETESEGGGHDGAAGMTGTGDAEAMLNICARRCMDLFLEIEKEEKE